MSKGTIELFTQDGQIKDYKLFSARLPEFLKAYPKTEGYRVRVTTSDTLSSKPSMFKLYEAAIAAGKNPTEVGLPALPAGDVVVFTASLLDKENNVLETASALRVIRQYKDWEKGETAARQRLIAALGFGGDCFDNDEVSDIEDQGMVVTDDGSTPRAATKPVPAARQESAPKQGPALKAEKPAATEETPAQAAPQEENKAAPAAEGSVVSQSESAAPVKDSNVLDEGQTVEVIPPRIIRQIEHQAKLKDQEIPPFSTVKEAKQVLKDLMRS